MWDIVGAEGGRKTEDGNSRWKTSEESGQKSTGSGLGAGVPESTFRTG